MVGYMDIKNQLENKNFILRQLNNNDFDLLYNIGKNKRFGNNILKVTDGKEKNLIFSLIME